MSDGRVEFEITADGKKAYASIDDITKALEKNGAKWEKTAKESTDNIGTSFEGMLKKIVAGFSAAAVGKALLNIGKEAINAASDLEEVQNVVDTTFGEQGAAKVESWAKKAGQQFGLTETQAKRFTSTLGAMMKSAGLAGDEIVGMSTDMAGLAADMASFYNLDFDTAFQKIRSGISGETEPLKQLGVNMSVANLEAFALQKGLDKTFSEMTQGEQVMLRYQYLMQATADAQGDFAKTADGFANSERRIETAIETIKTKGGEILMNVIGPLTTGLADILNKLTTQPERTVLDEFEDIDANTAQKLKDIQETAKEARELSSLLGEIEQSSSKAAQNLANGGTIEIPDKTAENAKTLADSLETVNKNTDVKDVNIAGEGSTLGDSIKKGAENAQKMMDNLKMDEIRQQKYSLDDTPLYDSVKKLDEHASGAGSGMKEFESAVQDLPNALHADAFSEVVETVEETASATEKAATASDEWLEVCQRLVKTIPGLATIIDTQTGEIQGGREAVDAYIDSWKQMQDNIALLDANNQKRAALDAKFSELPGLEIDMRVAENRVRKAKNQLDALYKKYGLDLTADSMTYVDQNYGLESDQITELNKELNYYKQLKKEADDATASYNKQKEARDEAEIALKEADQALLDSMDSTQKAQYIIDQYTKAQEAANAAVDEATAALTEYRKNAIDKTLQSVNSLISGFKKIEPTKLEDMPKPDEMVNALDSQLQFMREYQRNLEEAKKNGLDENLLAELSDGSQASADYLKALAQNPEWITQINEKYREVNKEKEKFAEGLTDSQLQVDEAYKELQKIEEEARDKQKEVEDAIAKNAGDCVAQMAANINAQADGLRQAVANVNSILSSLGLGVINIGGIDGSFASGLNWVPFDGFLAQLHEGEGILTAEENRVWQQFKTGQRGVDYDQLGGVMRDNIQPGGNVYLDGRVVGSVISQMQGNQYRTLQRSGWQG